MTSKLHFRAKTLDIYRPMPIYYSEELPEPAEQNAINRSVPAMPTGMEKEEESEKHIQDILERNGADDLYIPTPEVLSLDIKDQYQKMYRGGYKPPRQYIKVQPFPTDSEAPVYDMDAEDDQFMEEELKKKQCFEVDALQFENMIETLEKNSGHTVVTVNEAKHLLSGGNELIIAVYDYWVNKRLKLRHPLIPAVKSDKQDVGFIQTGNVSNSSVSSNPYVAFRRRTEKMLTRKNRKNDEISYEKMLKLRRDLTKAILIIEMVKNREVNKKDGVVVALQIFEKRYHAGDFEGRLIQEINAQRQVERMALQRSRFVESWVKQENHLPPNQSSKLMATINNNRKRRDKKRNLKSSITRNLTTSSSVSGSRFFPSISMNGAEKGNAYGTDEDRDFERASQDSEELLENTQSPFLFRRKADCWYLKNKRYLPFGISRPSKQLLLDPQSLVENAEIEETESSDTSDDDCVNGVDRNILWSTNGITDFKKHAKDYFPCSFQPLPSGTIAFASRRLSRGSRIVLDIAQVALPKKLEAEGPYEEKLGVPGIKEQIMGPRELDRASRSIDGWYDGLSQDIPNPGQTTMDSAVVAGIELNP